GSTALPCRLSPPTGLPPSAGPFPWNRAAACHGGPVERTGRGILPDRAVGSSRFRPVFLLYVRCQGHEPACQGVGQGGRGRGVLTSPLARGASPGPGRHLPVLARAICFP